MYIGKKIYLCYYKLDIYRSEKIDLNLIKNYKNYNFKSRNGKRYNTVVKYSTIKIKYFVYCKKTKKRKDYSTYKKYKNEKNELDRDIDKEKFKMSIHYMKKKLSDDLIFEISTFF